MGLTFRYKVISCEQQEWKIAKFDTKEEAIAACEEARKYDGAIYTPIILEALVQ